jgi:hypothetical protein
MKGKFMVYPPVMERQTVGAEKTTIGQTEYLRHLQLLLSRLTRGMYLVPIVSWVSIMKTRKLTANIGLGARIHQVSFRKPKLRNCL